MSWIQRLYDTYDKCLPSVSYDIEGGSKPLLPISHTTKQAQIEIVIDPNGNFKRAKVISKDDSRTIIPCTEESGGRTGKRPKPHPLSDKLQYVAKDFSEYGGRVTVGYSKESQKPYNEYEDQLKKWCESESSHPKAQAVLAYIRKGRVIKDLVDAGILFVGPDGKLPDRWEGKPVPDIFTATPRGYQGDAFVRWSVEAPGDPQSHLWTDNSMFESWIKFYDSTKKDKTLCLVTGESKPAAEQHPANLRYDGDKAKIISSNDKSGFTYRGRFLNSEQACSVGYEVTQKAHNALRWLLDRQGYKKNNQAIVAWSVVGNPVPDPLMDSFDLLSSDSSVPASTSQEFALKLNQKIKGYSAKLEDSTGIVVMGLDSAVPGRMSIAFYRELSKSDFLKRIEEWHETCSWWIDWRISTPSGTNKKRVPKFVGAPSPSDIVDSAYGFKANDELRKATVERLLPCIIDGQRIPRDLVESAVRRASNRIGMEEYEWKKTISVACAIYRKYHENEGFEMALEENRLTRDYLYGRLLAVANSIESWALSESTEARQTTAARLMNRFADHPATTWKTIYLSLAPYKARLGGKVYSREKLITEIGSKFQLEDFNSDKKLSGEFLLGYYCQSEALRAQKKSNIQESGVADTVNEDNEVGINVE